MNNKDWTGNAKSIFICHGASNHTDEDRQADDYYATEPKAVEILLQEEEFSDIIWEPACGGGHMTKILEEHGHNVISSDIVDRGYPYTQILDFLKVNPKHKNFIDIITNPPYKYAKEFVEKALDMSANGVKVAMFLKLTFLEGKARRDLFEKYPPKTVYVFRSRVDCWKNGIEPNKPSKAVAYAWFVWEKGYVGNPIIKWVN